MSGFYFGPLGAMRPLVVSAGVNVETGRGFSEFVSSGGVRHVQRGRAAPRTWQVARQWQGPDWVRLLSLAAHGLIGECWLYDVAAARQNMIPAQLAAGRGASVLVGGLPMGALSVGHTVRMPVLAGKLYSLSGWRASDGAMFTYAIGSATPVPVFCVGGNGAASFTPATDATITITVTASDVSGIRLNEGPFDGVFHAGNGTPCRVAVKDPEQVLQMVTDKTRIDYTVTLLEVGKTGQA